MKIRRYQKSDDLLMINLLKNQGEEWRCCWDPNFVDSYKDALEKSITYVAYEDEKIIGYIRCLDDFGFYIYVCDLLVEPDYRGQSIGRKLMEYVMDNYSSQVVYVMSDVDEYYKKLNYEKEGSIFKVVK